MTDTEKSLREQPSPSDEFEYDLETRALYRQLMASGKAHPITTVVSTPRKPEIIDAYIWLLEPGKKWAGESSLPEPVLDKELLVDFVQL